MGEHQTGWQKTLYEKTGQDVYFWNFVFLMVFTAIEVGAVYLSRYCEILWNCCFLHAFMG